MGGRIFLGGGGSASDEIALWREMLPPSGRRRRVVYWPVALPEERRPGAAAWLASALTDLGLEADVDAWLDLRDHRPAALAGADLLFVGGGDTFSLLRQVREAGMVEAVRWFVAGGGDYYGGSAGAVLPMADIGIARVANDPAALGSSDTAGLGLLRGVTVHPHFGEADLAYVRSWATEHHVTVLGIPERGGVVVDGARATALGDLPVTVVTADGEVGREPGESWDLSGGRGG